MGGVWTNAIEARRVSIGVLGLGSEAIFGNDLEDSAARVVDRRYAERVREEAHRDDDFALADPRGRPQAARDTVDVGSTAGEGELDAASTYRNDARSTERTVDHRSSEPFHDLPQGDQQSTSGAKRLGFSERDRFLADVDLRKRSSLALKEQNRQRS